jgi:glutamate racemase
MLWAESEGRAPHLGPVDTIALFATPRTVDSGVFQTEIAKRRPDLKVIAQACPLLAGAIEAGRPTHELQAMIADYVDSLRQHLGGNPSRAILGCTHYPLVADLFAAALGPEVTMIDQPSAVAQALAQYLPRHPEYLVSPGQGRCRMLTTGYQPQAMALAESYWGTELSFETITFGERAA